MAQLIDLKLESVRRERALLVGIIKDGESRDEAQGLIAELKELAKNLRIDSIAEELVKPREINPHYLIGKGKFLEIAEMAKSLEADLIILDDELSPAQQRNWEIGVNIPVVNRQEIILDIFAARAQTREARLQVELAKLEYALPRLHKAWSHLDRQRGGGVTQRGGGESQLELDRRYIGEQISKLKCELAQVRVVRGTQRKRRTRVPVPAAAVVGYTNAGKSSLINRLANASLLAADKLFATLDPTTRKVQLPNNMDLLLTDTVGFVRKLPHRFVEAFKATLEEAMVSDFLIHVVDSSNPDAFEHIKTTLDVLGELGADGKKIITVMNKTDIHSDDGLKYSLRMEYPDAVWVSTRTGEGIAELLRKMEDMISHTVKAVRLLIPHSEYRAVAELHDTGAVRSQKITDSGVEIFANLPVRLVETYKKWEIQS